MAKIPTFAALAAVILFSGCSGPARYGTVVVSGLGTVRASPDTLQMSISLRHTAPTTDEAQREVAVMVRQALEILAEAGVEERDIATAFLRFSPDYEWGPAGRALLGQRAEQAITFSVREITDDDARATGIVDGLTGINGIELAWMHFSLADTSALLYRARELAYLDALGKARQFAGLSGRRIAGTSGIVEEGASPMPAHRLAVTRAAPQVMWAGDAAAEAGGTVLPTGETEVTARITVEFVMR